METSYKFIVNIIIFIITIILLLFSLLSTRLFLWLESTFCECDLYKITFRYLYPDGNIENPTKT